MTAYEALSAAEQQRGNSWKYSVPTVATMQKDDGRQVTSRNRDKQFEMDAPDWIEWKARRLNYEFGGYEKAAYQEATQRWATIETDPTKAGYADHLYVDGKLKVWETHGSERHRDDDVYSKVGVLQSGKSLAVSED